MDSSRSKLDMSLDEIIKSGHNRQNRQVKRLDNNRRHSFPSGQRQQNNRNRSSTSNFNGNHNNNNNFNKGFNNRPTLTNRSRGTVQIGNLSPEVNEDDLIQLFNTIGEVERAEVMYDNTGNSRGIAKVVFRQLQDAMDAVERYNNVRLDGQPMKMFLVQELQTAQRSQFQQNNRRNEGNRFVRNYDSQRSNNNRNGFSNGNFNRQNNNRNFNNNRQRGFTNGHSNFNNRRQMNNNKPKEINREDLDRDLEEFVASR